MTAPTDLRFRKKPVEIEAFQMTKERRMDNSEWPRWLHEAWNGNRNEPGTLQRVDMVAQLPDMLQIVTLEGLHLVSWDDWVIRGVKGELYPCKPDIFEATYEPAALPASGAGWRPLTCKKDRMTCPMPADETVVEVMLQDGMVCPAWYSCNIMEAGDWDFMPVDTDGEPDDDADSLAAKIVAWRPVFDGEAN